MLFNRSGGRTNLPVSFAVKGGGMIKYLVTDLAEGTWQVWRDGSIVYPAVLVTKDEGILCFEGPAGSYSLRR